MKRMWSAALGVATGLTALALTGAAHAATNQPIAQTGGAEISLIGIPLDVSVELNTDTGDITAVNVTDGNGTAADMTATKVTPTKVRFASNADGTTKVSVSAKKNQLSFGVRTDSLKKLEGANTWASDIFGTGAKTTVPYTIGETADGSPTFAFGTPTGLPADVTATDLGTWNGGKRGDDDDGQDMSAGGRMSFERDGFKKLLSIWVAVDDHDGTPTASLRVTLTGNNVQRKQLADLVGAKTWTGLLCDGTTRGTIAYAVSADGTVTVPTPPDGATVDTTRSGVIVRFATGDKVSIRLMTKEDGTAALAVNVSGRKCTATRPTVAPPKVNTPVSTMAPKTDNTGKAGGGDHRGGGDHKKGNNG